MRLLRIVLGGALVAVSIPAPFVVGAVAGLGLRPDLGVLAWPLGAGTGLLGTAFVAPFLGSGLVLIDPTLAERARSPVKRRTRHAVATPTAWGDRARRDVAGPQPVADESLAPAVPKLSSRYGYHALTLAAVAAGAAGAVVLLLVLIPGH